jgi:putative photosynthetic complex assembly protein
MSHSHTEMVPRGALIGAAGMIAITIAAAGLSQLTDRPSMVPDSAPAIARDLRFEDRTDGGVDVYDAANQARVTVIAPGADAFVRATVRGLAQQRKRENKDDSVPFRLTAWEDGRLTIDDAATGRHVELEAFGHTNEEAFARLLRPEAGGETLSSLEGAPR